MGHPGSCLLVKLQRCIYIYIYTYAVWTKYSLWHVWMQALCVCVCVCVCSTQTCIAHIVCECTCGRGGGRVQGFQLGEEKHFKNSCQFQVCTCTLGLVDNDT